MKKVLLVFCNALLLVMFFCFGQCKKKYTPLTITLYNKPLGTIQNYIQGKWKCHYGKGGIAANYVQYYNDFYWTFSANNRIQQLYNGSIVTDTTINWVWTWNSGTWLNYGDSTFIMNFYDKLGYPFDYVVDRISNDTLILHDDAADAVFYHLTKSN